MDWTPDWRCAARPRSALRRRRHPRRRARHRRRARRGGRDGDLHRPQQRVRQRAVRLRPSGNHRGDSRTGHVTRWRRRRRSRSTTSTSPRCGRSPIASATTTARIDILVNDIWGAEVLKGRPPTWNRPIWEHDLDDGLRILRLGVDTHLITSHCLLPLLVTRPGGLLVEVTDGTKEYNDAQLPDLGVLRPCEGRGEPARVQPRPRTGAVRRDRRRRDAGLAALGDDARQLRVSPRTNWRTALDPDRPDGHPIAPPGFAESETPRYRRPRASRPSPPTENRSRWNQRSVTSAELAREYGFTDIDGRQPDGWTRHTPGQRKVDISQKSVHRFR